MGCAPTSPSPNPPNASEPANNYFFNSPRGTVFSPNEWDLIAPLLPGSNRLGRPRKAKLRDVWDAIQCIAVAGCEWSLLPREFPPVRVLVVIGVNARGEKHFLANEDRVRESTQSPLSGFAGKPLPATGREILLALKVRDLGAPKEEAGHMTWCDSGGRSP